MSTPNRSMQLHLWWTALIVLTALGGAGLAVAADRQQNPVQRPELTWHADGEARTWIDAMARELEAVHAAVGDLSTAGRNVLGRLQALDLAEMDEALASGDGISSEVESAVARLAGLSSEAATKIERWRLGPRSLDVLEQLDAVVITAQQPPADWRGLALDARTMASLVESLRAHDGLVFEATTAGRKSRWQGALALLDRARQALSEAAAVRDELAARSSVETLDELLGRYLDYDDALAELYTHVRDTGSRSGATFDSLEAAAAQAQAALPSDNSVLTVIVGEGAGPPIADALAAIEQVLGSIEGVLEAVTDAQNGPSDDDVIPLGTDSP